MESIQPFIDDGPIKLKCKPNDIKTSEYNIKVPFVSLFIGARGSGKSYTLTKLLKKLTQEKAITRIFIICSTYYSNPQYEEILQPNKDDVYIDVDDSNIFTILEEIREKNREEQEAFKKMNKYYEAYQLFKKRKFDKIDETMANEIIERDAEIPDQELIKHPPSACIVLDDMAFTKAFSTSKKNPLTSLVSFHRHERISLAMVSQAYMAVPKSIRLNSTVYFIYPTHNKKEKKLMYEEFGNLLEEEQFYRVFDKATDTKHCFLMITLDPKKTYPSKFRKGFNTFIFPDKV